MPEAKHAASWLALLGLLSYISHAGQDHLPKGGTTHSGSGLPTTIYKDTPQAGLQVNLMGAFSQLRLLLPTCSKFVPS